MPGIVTHYMFGIDVHESLAETIGEASADFDAFLLGNQGPDPFFYLMATPWERELRRIGQTMHRRKVPELLSSLHDRLEDGPCKAYALGFLCHYLLDSTVHPLVYAQQHAICAAGVEGLSGEWAQRVVHATIETEIDECILTSRLDATAATLPPHKTMLLCNDMTLEEVSRGYSKVLWETYGLSAPESVFSTAVNLYRLAQQALDSKSNGLRRRFDYLDWAGMPSKYALALSLRSEPRSYTPFANDDHASWENPYADGLSVSESFDELYACAFTRAIERLPVYADPSFDLDSCRELVGNVNFLGRAID